MKKIIAICICCFCFLFSKAQETNKERALKALDYILHKEYLKLEALYDTSLANAFKKDNLNIDEIMKELERSVGEFEKSYEPNINHSSKGDLCNIRCDFVKETVIFQTFFNKEGKMTGIFFRDGPSKVVYHAPAYVDTNLIIQKPINLVSGKFRLSGVLTMPKGKANVPLLVLVHGSGPSDMDETTYKNKPFKDLALGLAAKGIATLRYDKRTFSYGASFTEKGNSFTVKEETTEDAISAILLVKTISEIDTSKIFLAGHSLGAMLAPRIAKAAPFLAGIIMLAGPARPLEDLILEQNNFFLPTRALSNDEKRNLETVKREVRQVKKVKPIGKLPKDSTIFGLPLSYWQDLNNYSQIKTAKTINQPLLVLQGERDFQVTMTDFNLWKKAMQTKPNVAFKSYPKLNHLFEEGEGKGSMEKYHVQLNIPEYVMSDIANWVAEVKK